VNPPAPVQPLAILGGTFDPVHNGHLRVALEAAEFLDAEVRLVPSRVPPHRPPPLAGADERAAMLRAALAGQQRLALDERELRREGPSWTIDTLISLRTEMGADRPLVLLLGADAFAGLPDWHRWHELFDLAHIGVLTRAGHQPVLPIALRTRIASRRAWESTALSASPAGRVLTITVTPLDISASQVRDLVATGRDPRWLVPDAVLAQLGVYGEPRPDR
jgi:nicotinate-nucleotide adenylyltransferase